MQRWTRHLAGRRLYPLAARAGKVPSIGLLGTATPKVWSSWIAAFAERLGELGWIDGRTIAIEYHWAEGRDERYTEYAASHRRAVKAML